MRNAGLGEKPDEMSPDTEYQPVIDIRLYVDAVMLYLLYRVSFAWPLVKLMVLTLDPLVVIFIHYIKYMNFSKD